MERVLNAVVAVALGALHHNFILVPPKQELNAARQTQFVLFLLRGVVRTQK